MPSRSPKTTAEERARAEVERLKAAADDPEAHHAIAAELIASSAHMEVLRAALAVVEPTADAAIHDLLVDKYAWCEAHNAKRDGSGYIRAAIVRALRPIVGPDDRPLLLRALQTYQQIGIYEVCAELRAVALLAINEIDPETAELFACRFLEEHSADKFSGEPARTATKLLASHAQVAPLFGAASTGRVHGELAADMLRNLTGIPADLLPLVVDRFAGSEDEQEVLGLFDLILGHPTRDDWIELVATFFTTTTLVDVYGIVAMEIVASRSEALIALLRQLATSERDPVRRRLLNQALALA